MSICIVSGEAEHGPVPHYRSALHHLQLAVGVRQVGAARDIHHVQGQQGDNFCIFLDLRGNYERTVETM